LAAIAVNLPILVYAQDEQPRPDQVEPTVGEAVATQREQPAPEQPAPEQPAPEQPAPQEPTSKNAEPINQQSPPAEPDQSPPAAASTAHSMMDAVRRAAARQLIPPPPAEDLRLRTLDTSFPAEQPQLDVPEPPREVVAAPVGPVPPREPSRRTVVRVVDGVTVLTNVTDDPGGDNAAYASAASPRTIGALALDARQEQAAMAVAPREVSVNANALSPASKAANSTGLGVWLWGLAGFAVLLLVPIGVLLTRPVRRG
jgi:hypothetical protein